MANKLQSISLPCSPNTSFFYFPKKCTRFKFTRGDHSVHNSTRPTASMPNNDDSLYNSTNMDTSDDMDYINVYNGNNSILVAVFCEILLREVPRGA